MKQLGEEVRNTHSKNRESDYVRAEEIIVRKATSKDTDGIINVLKSTKLAEETWKGNERWVKRALQKSLSNRNHTILVAEFDSTIIGFIDCIVFPSFWECAKQGIINHLFVHAAYQSKGVGAKLVRTITERADAEDIAEMHVSTEWENAKARKLYGKYGFTEERLLLERSQ
jgi:ribosomal protein S18 acetylase RimI-like enzyme